MAGLLGIAAGAIKIGQKIFSGIKARKEKKVEKKAAALVEAQNKQAQAEGKIGALLSSMGGNDSQVISGSGNFLAGIKSAFSPNETIANFQPVSGAIAVNQQNKEAARVSGGMGDMKPILLFGGFVLVIWILKKLRVI
jgi:hypothetical protein